MTRVKKKQPPKKKTRRSSSKSRKKTPVCESSANHELALKTVPIPSDFIDEGDEGDIDSDGFATEGTVIDRESGWEVSDFSSSGDLCDEWLP